MRRGDSVDDRNHDAQHTVDRQTAVGNGLGQRPTLDQFHRQEELAVRLLRRIDRHDAGMIERCNRVRLALEPLATFRVVCDSGRQDLDRHQPIQSRVARSVHLSHATGAEIAEDFIGAETAAGVECHDEKVS